MAANTKQATVRALKEDMINPGREIVHVGADLSPKGRLKRHSGSAEYIRPIQAMIASPRNESHAHEADPGHSLLHEIIRLKTYLQAVSGSEGWAD